MVIARGRSGAAGGQPDPRYGIADRIAVALFPFMEGRPDPDLEAGA